MTDQSVIQEVGCINEKCYSSRIGDTGMGSVGLWIGRNPSPGKDAARVGYAWEWD